MQLRRTAPLLFPLLLALGACETLQPTPVEEIGLWSGSAAGVDDRDLARLCTDVWEAQLAANPIQATYLGDPRYHGELPRLALEHRNARRDELQEFGRQARRLDSRPLDDADRLTLELLQELITQELTRLDLNLQQWSVDPLDGPHQQLLNLTNVQPVETPRQRRQLVERWESFDRWLRQLGRELREGKRRGRVASHTAVAKVIGQLDDILAVDPMDSPLVTIAIGGGHWIELEPGDTVAKVAHDHLGDARRQRELRQVNLHLQEGRRLTLGTRVLVPAAADPLSPEERGRFLNDTLLAVEGRIYPALAAYRDLLRSEILPHARSDGEPGLVHLPGGEEMYRQLIHEHTSLPLEECDAKAIHEFGLAEVRRIRAEISTLGERVFGTHDVAEIQERLRTDPAMHFSSREEVQAKATEAFFRARDAMPRYFGVLPEAPCEVVPVPAHEEKDTTIAYYREPAPDGTRPGRYFINTYQPETRPRYEAEVLAYHEAIPGHHLQIAIAQEQDELPLFRRHWGSTAFVEGWALYTERLCDEMGLYSGDVDRLGVLSFDAWRASRLVVDTGLHHFGWSRKKAIEFLYRNTLLARNNVENEVDRYIAWPGQALAYKLGQREILELRARAEAELGGRFDVREFHDRVLENGAVSLSSLRNVVERWIQGG